MKIAKAVLLLVFGWICVVQSHASLCDEPSKVHKLEASTTGEVIEGPACVQVEVNALRYSAQLVKTITFTPGPNLAGVFPTKRMVIWPWSTLEQMWTIPVFANYVSVLPPKKCLSESR